MTEGKTVSMGDLFTDDQIATARKILDKHRKGTFVSAAIDDLVSEVTEPALGHINKVTGQENDARYLAYLLAALAGSVGT